MALLKEALNKNFSYLKYYLTDTVGDACENSTLNTFFQLSPIVVEDWSHDQPVSPLSI